MGGQFCASIFTLAALMQMGAHFPILSNALRMMNLDAPEMAFQGDTIQLSCSYSLVTTPAARSPRDRREVAARSAGSKLTNDAARADSDAAAAAVVAADWKRTRDILVELDVVYAVKWYRDEREFFRYLAQDWPHKQAFAAEGLNIDVEKSDNRTVVLRNVTLRTSGLFRCEVSTDAPSFLTKSIERKLLVHSLPNEGPTLELLNRPDDQLQYRGDQLNFRCSSPESKPAAQLDWIINETLNLTEAQSSPATLSLQEATRRIVRLPVTAGDGQSRSSPAQRGNAKGAIDAGARRPAYVLETGAEQHQQAPLLASELRDLDAQSALPPSDKSTTHPIALTAGSLQQLPETTISWLNVTVDANLLQHLSRASALANKLTTNSVNSARKADGALGSHSAPTNRGSLGRIPAKRNPRAGRDPNVWQQKRFSPNGSTQDGRVLLRVRCVARVLHLGLSDDIRLRVINKSRDRAVQDAANASVRRDKITQANNSAGSRSSLAWFTMIGLASASFAHLILSQH